MDSFDGEDFAGGILLVIVIALLIYGSTEIKNLTGAPSAD
ncbi:hypothetical protein SAMN05216191_111122 [Paenibacillus jilunlii]|uniref:Uncharacterized protein n=1 Tax=Paenibacillus jilunlii TaxID=682956 RepID=A0A1G9S9C2_9BACL|nr:hypothetical protein SAMN05216191_111122 [Paenibacillus jilunlii]